MKDDWIKEFVFWAMDIEGNTICWCQRYSSEKDDYICILERNHQGYHRYKINGKEVVIYGCCPDGQVVKYEE